MKKIHIDIRFIEPIRIMNWFDPAERKPGKKMYTRGLSFARWHENRNKKGAPFITGTLLRSKVIRAAEFLLTLSDGKIDKIPCCPGRFYTKDPKIKSKKLQLRKRPTVKWSSGGLCDDLSPCPLCTILGHGNRYMHFSNLMLPEKPEFDNIHQVADMRVINRVDYHTGKAHDFYRIFEIDHMEYPIFQGEIELKNNISQAAEKLLKNSLRFVDTFCGAMCVINIDNELDKPSGVGNVVTSHQPAKAEKEIANTIISILENKKKTDKLKTLSASVRSLRGDRNMVSSLPCVLDRKGKPDHHLWDIKSKDGKSIRNLLEEKKNTVPEGTWRNFCENLGQSLYLKYKEQQGGFSAKTRILGKRVACELPERKDATFLIPVDAKSETVIYGRLVAETPFFFGVEAPEASQVDMMVLLDRKNRFRLPRSVLRGIIRRDLRTVLGTGCDAAIGGKICNCEICQIMGNLTVMDARSNYAAPPETRSRIRINPFTGAVAEGALFDMEVGPEGLSFPFVLRYRGKNTLPQPLVNVFYWWSNGMAFLGGGAATGKSRFRLTQSDESAFIFRNEEDLVYPATTLNLPAIMDDYLAQRGWREKEHLLSVNNYYPVKNPKPPLWNRIDINIILESPFLNGDPIQALLGNNETQTSEAKTGVDIVSFTKYTDTGRKRVYAYKGESFRGVVRTAVGKRSEKDDDRMSGQKLYPLILSHKDCDCILCRLFGSEFETGKLRFEDLSFSRTLPPKTFLFDHVAIDRFTGGAADKKKFDDLSLIQPNDEDSLVLNGLIWVKGNLLEKEMKALAGAFADIQNGLYPLGGKAGIGYGRVKTIHIQGDEKLSDQFHNIAGSTLTDETTSVLEKPEFNGAHILDRIKPEMIFYPHYFLKPHKKVNRKKIPTAHYTLRNDDGQQRLTGRICCRLTTKTPLIIPDTSNDDFFGLAGVNAKKEKEYHKSFDFFSIDGCPAIPGSSIRGMISSVYEALTNSCFRILDEKKRLSWRMDADVKKLESWFPGRISDKIENNSGKIDFKIKKMKQYRYPFYDWIDENNNDNLFKRYKESPSYYDHPTNAEQKMLSLVEPNRGHVQNGLGHKSYYNIIKPNSSSRAEFMFVATPYENAHGYNPQEIQMKKKSGYLKISGPNKIEKELVEKSDLPDVSDHMWKVRHNGLIGDFDSKKCTSEDSTGCTKKHNPTVECDELNLKKCKRFRQFPAYMSFQALDDGSGKGIEYTMKKRCERVFIDMYENEDPIPVAPQAIEKYKELVCEYEKNAKQQETPEVFQTILPHKIRGNDQVIDVGDLFYFRKERNPKTEIIEVVEIIPVQISREVDNKYLGNHFEQGYEGLRPCHGEWLGNEDLSKLNPYSEKKLFTRHKDGLCPACRLFGTGSYKGRVRFGFAKIDGEPQWQKKQGTTDDIKITLPLLEQPRPTWSIPNKEGIIPGRKFYIHHNGWNDVCERKHPFTKEDITPNKNNRTVKVLAAGATFNFDLFFENIEDFELGLLLYSLILESGLSHKIGMGKPFGFGSIDIDITQIFITKDDGSWSDETLNAAQWLDAGKTKMAEWFGFEWDEIAHLKQLKELLFRTDDQNPTVHYPPLKKKNGIKGYTDLKSELTETNKLKKLLNTPWEPWNQ